jgi:hypothetical protein
MSRRITALLLAAAALPALPPAASAATRSAYDRDAGVRLTLEGRVLTAKLVRSTPATRKKLYGRRIEAACGAVSDAASADLVHVARKWPRGHTRRRFRFGRDISEQVEWCLLEDRSGGDIAVVHFE